VCRRKALRSGGRKLLDLRVSIHLRISELMIDHFEQMILRGDHVFPNKWLKISVVVSHIPISSQMRIVPASTGT